MDGIQWQTIAVFVSVLAVWSTLLLKAMDWILGHKVKAFEKQFLSAEKRIEKIEQAIAEIRHDYVKREDWMLLSTKMEAKLDVVMARSEALSAALSAALATAQRRNHVD